MNTISVLGMGYVGCVSAACLAKLSSKVIGIDIDPHKVRMINDGKSPIIEKGLAELIAEGRASGRLEASTDAASALLRSDIALVCVGTPCSPSGQLDLSAVKRAAETIGSALKARQDYSVVAIRSTMLPGSVEGSVKPVLEAASGKRSGLDFGLCICPEFLRESTSIEDFFHPPLTLIGEEDARCGDAVQAIFDGIEADVVRTDWRTAEIVKYLNNAFHALKITFANEVGRICKRLGIDSHTAMDLLCRDRKLNISSTYLKPGFAFGGSCLPKDLTALNYLAKHMDVETPLLNSIMPSNGAQIASAMAQITRNRSKKVGVLGLSFKEGTDDLRESPLVHLIETLLGRGYQLRVYDYDVNLAKIFGANKRYIEREIPHISTLMTTDLELVVESSDILVIGKRSDEFTRIAGLLRPEQVVIDLVRMFPDPSQLKCRYDGIAW